jgi:hypothetical protein
MNVHKNANCACSKCKECKERKSEFAYRSVTVCPHFLAVMCIFVIYKYLSCGGDQQRDLGKPS